MPSLNDVTAPELRVILDRISEIDTTIDEAWNTTNLIRVFESASASPCIDLSRITLGLAKECEDADLIVIEGNECSTQLNSHHFQEWEDAFIQTCLQSFE